MKRNLLCRSLVVHGVMAVAVVHFMIHVVSHEEFDEVNEAKSFPVALRHLSNNRTLYNLPSSKIAIPDGCVEPADQAIGWPIEKVGTCGETYLFKFDKQLTRPERDKDVTVSLPYADESLACDQAIMRCDILDFRHLAHFIVNFLPCWSAWLEYIQENNTDTLLLLVFGDERIVGGDGLEVSPVVQDWMEIYGCGAEVGGKIYGSYQPACPSWDRKYVDVNFGLPKGNGFHFNLPFDRIGPVRAGMRSYFYHPEHAYLFRSIGIGKRGGKIDAVDHRKLSKVASLTFNVLFINRNNGKRVVGGGGITNISSSIHNKLLGLGIPSKAIRVNETDAFGAWDGHRQMQMMHEHDIIIFPHGNQWSNIGFAPECAAVLEIHPNGHAMPGYFLPWAVNAGIQAFGMHDGLYISITEFLADLDRSGRVVRRDAPWLNVRKEIVMAIPALAQARRECCQALLDNNEWIRAIDARCVQ